jgi:AcrR family transcriptional regulator
MSKVMDISSKKNLGGRPLEFCLETALDAATGVFASKGFDAASLDDLCSAMGINRPSLYLHFGNKEALYLKSLERYSRMTAQDLETCLSDPSARAGIERRLHEVVMMSTDPHGPGVCFTTQGPLKSRAASAATREELGRWRGATALRLRARFDKAVMDGELSPGTNTESLANYYMVLMQGLAAQAQHGSERAALLNVLDVAMAAWPAPR